MYWYNNIKQTALLSIGAVCFFFSCDNPIDDTVEQNSSLYFDIPGYFENQINDLSKSNPLVLKQVFDNDGSEKKEIHISNWNTELSSFMSIDLNKPAYAGHIVKDSADNVVNYKFTNNDLDLNSVQIIYQENMPIQITIDKTTKNMLYQTDEKLVYIADSLYSVQKLQKVIWMNPNNYKIIGLIK